MATIGALRRWASALGVIDISPTGACRRVDGSADALHHVCERPPGREYSWEVRTARSSSTSTMSVLAAAKGASHRWSLLLRRPVSPRRARPRLCAGAFGKYSTLATVWPSPPAAALDGASPSSATRPAWGADGARDVRARRRMAQLRAASASSSWPPTGFHDEFTARLNFSG